MKFPVVVSVNHNGAVFIETPDRQVGMNRWSERGQRIAACLGEGEHHIHSDEKNQPCWDDIAEVLS